ncbi:hypothetical protein, partial [Legionella oakridgensis]|uniref:hypothetical protein n=1 Tax=Legionella oakridgensis TaxID=29423 RepID=UPI001B80A8AF
MAKAQQVLSELKSFMQEKIDSAQSRMDEGLHEDALELLVEALDEHFRTMGGLSQIYRGGEADVEQLKVDVRGLYEHAKGLQTTCQSALAAEEESHQQREALYEQAHLAAEERRVAEERERALAEERRVAEEHERALAEERRVAEERERTLAEERRVAEERRAVEERRAAQERERTTAKERATTTINKAFEEFQGVIFRGLADNLSQPSQRKHDIYSAAQTLLDDLKLATKTYLNDPLNPTAQTAFKAICNDLIEQSLKGDIAKEPTLAQACLKCLQEIVNAVVKYTVGLIPGGPQRMFAVAETETVKELKALQTKLNKGDLTAP